MRKKNLFRYAAGILLGSALAAGSMGVAVLAEDFSAEPAGFVEISEWVDFEDAENPSDNLPGEQAMAEHPEETPDEALAEAPEEALDEASSGEVQEELVDELPAENPDMEDAADEIPGISLPAVRELTYSGEAQELLDPSGMPDDTEYYYFLDGETYGRDIPSGTNAGEYTVYVKTADDAEAEAYELAVTIAKADVVFTPPVAAN